MPEVPAHQRVDRRNRGQRNVLHVRTELADQDLFRFVFRNQRENLGCHGQDPTSQCQDLLMKVANRLRRRADFRRRHV